LGLCLIHLEAEYRGRVGSGQLRPRVSNIPLSKVPHLGWLVRISLAGHIPIMRFLGPSLGKLTEFPRADVSRQPNWVIFLVPNGALVMNHLKSAINAVIAFILGIGVALGIQLVDRAARAGYAAGSGFFWPLLPGFFRDGFSAEGTAVPKQLPS